MAHKPLKNGRFPVALRVTFDRKRKYAVLKYFATIKEHDIGETISTNGTSQNWNSVLGRFNRDKYSNYQLEQYEFKANEIVKSLKDGFSFTKFFDEFGTKKQNNIFDLFKDVIQDKKSNNKLSTASSYKDAMNRLKEFHPKDLAFEDVSPKFLTEFDAFLQNKGNSTNSIAIFMRNIRAIFNTAIGKSYVESKFYTFGARKNKKYEIVTEEVEKRALTKDQIYQLFSYPVERGSSQWHSLNFFKLSYLCHGMNFKDMASLEWSKNVDLEMGRVTYERAKTGNTRSKRKKLQIKIDSRIAEILSEYSNNQYYVLPILRTGMTEVNKRNRVLGALKKINKDLQFIATQVRIPRAKQVTFYWARHTYATVLKRSGFGTSIISETLGHSSERTTKAYLDKFDQTQIDAINDTL